MITSTINQQAISSLLKPARNKVFLATKRKINGSVVKFDKKSGVNGGRGTPPFIPVDAKGISEYTAHRTNTLRKTSRKLKTLLSGESIRVVDRSNCSTRHNAADRLISLAQRKWFLRLLKKMQKEKKKTHQDRKKKTLTSFNC